MSKMHRFEADGKIYHIAVIDYLQEWNCAKKVERLYKTKVRGFDGKQLSAIMPGQYADRFIDFMEAKVFN
mgnify:FL=1